MSFSYIIDSILADTAINPIKILVLFFSMTILSVFLDEIGFFRYLANSTLKKAGTSQKKLFFLLYIIVSVLTVFTSNDIIVLTFTPFICYFASAAKIKPLPYLITVFVAANTWSMALIIGNPTNIYLATSGGIDFLAYFKTMIFPTFAAGISSFAILYLIFSKEFSKPMEPMIGGKSGFITNPVLLFAGLLHLAVCTIMLAASSYAGIEMWKVSGIAVLSLFAFNLVFALAARRLPKELFSCLRRSPWTLIPFLLSMFVLILFFKQLGIPFVISRLLGEKFVVAKYGLSSCFACNLINNIPMSVLFSSIIEPLPPELKNKALFATIAGSNLGAFLTPIGALAGVMWRKILKQQKIDFSAIDFIRYGCAVGIPGIIIAILALLLVV